MDDMLRVLIFVVSLMGTLVLAYGGMSVISLMRKRAERAAAGPGSPPEELEAIHGRLDAAEALEARVTDLEERLDFAERMLARQHEPEALPGGSPPERH